MVSKNFLLVSLILLIVPIVAFSQNRDYLFIFGTYDGTNYTIDSIEQRVVPINSSPGNYEIRLFSKNKLVGNSFFEIPEPGPIKIPFDGGFIEEEGRKQVIFMAEIPLSTSLDVNQARIQFLKSGQILLEKKLTEIPISVLSVQNYELRTLERIESEKSVRGSKKNLVIFSLVGIGMILFGWYFWKRKNKKDNTPYNQ